MQGTQKRKGPAEEPHLAGAARSHQRRQDVWTEGATHVLSAR